ncbi:ATP-binding protein [Actinospica durhamensis]|uniref:ATP-binding protein n=1 Tax=Actinospica durhamensis TaxID=1508375 RepID=A0A941ENU6_9ACTN|nr:ATP-binding protein [Actinospica durhamensis]MBR7832449.1 ATP-binding protein [Actinospica durhamensis]
MSTMALDTLVNALEIRAVGNSSPSRARSWLTQVLEAAGTSQDTIDTALLAVSELVTNAVVHTDSARILVSAQVVDGGVRLVVHDDDAPADWQGPSRGLAERGRGLLLIQALAAEFDIDRHTAGTTVTCLIPMAA